MSDSYVQVAPDSSGKKLQTFENTVGGQTVEAEAVVLADASGVALTTRALSSATTDSDVGLVVHAMIHGHTTAGGGSFVDVKVNPSGAIQVGPQTSATATTTQVADTASSTTLLASNANRLGASIQNDSSAVLYVKCGTTASTTDYSARLVQYGYYEVPANYTGRIDGIWATDPNDGAARITEFT